MMAARRRAPPRPSLARRVGSWLLGEVSGRHAFEAAGRRLAMERPTGRDAAVRDRERRSAQRTAHEGRMQQLRETREQRAAAILWHRQEYYRARAETERAKAERARSGEVRRASEGKAATAAKKADEFAEMTRKAEAGQLSPDQLRYYVNKYGQSGRKRK